MSAPLAVLIDRQRRAKNALPRLISVIITVIILYMFQQRRRDPAFVRDFQHTRAVGFIHGQMNDTKVSGEATVNIKNSYLLFTPNSNVSTNYDLRP